MGVDIRSVKDMDEIVDKSTGGDDGAEEGPVNNIDEIGFIFDIGGI